MNTKNTNVFYFPGFGAGPTPGPHRPFLEYLVQYFEVHYMRPRRYGVAHFIWPDLLVEVHDFEQLVEKQVISALEYAKKKAPPSRERGKNIVVGTSLGALYATAFCLRYPADELVLISPSSAFEQRRREIAWGFIKKSLHLAFNESGEIRKLAALQALYSWTFFCNSYGFPRLPTLWAEVHAARMPVLEDFLQTLLQRRDAGKLPAWTKVLIIAPQRDHLFYCEDQNLCFQRWSDSMGSSFDWIKSDSPDSGHDYIFWWKELAGILFEKGILPNPAPRARASGG